MEIFTAFGLKKSLDTFFDDTLQRIKIMDDKLQVGDKIVWVNILNNHHIFDVVERITPMHTQAVTYSGRKIQRKGFLHSGKVLFKEVGVWKMWERATDEIFERYGG